MTASHPLADRIRQHDVTALAQFLEEHRRQLATYIERQLGAALRRKVEPDDILQEVSAEAVRALPGIELGDRDVFGWLCQLSERRIIDAHRRYFGAQKRAAGREVSLDAPASDSEGGGIIHLLVASMTSASAAFSRNVKEMRVQQALADLPAEQREALRLRYVENLPSKEIAVQMGKSDAAIRVMLTRSLQRLQKMLEAPKRES